MSDHTTAPLLSTATAGGTGAGPPFHWPHYVGAGLLIVATAGALLTALFSSLWTALAGVLLLAGVSHAAHRFYKRHLPRAPHLAPPPRFLVAQFALGALLAPPAAALVTVPAVLVLSVLFVLSLAFLFTALAAKYPDAMRALLLPIGDADAHTTAHVGAAVRAVVSRPVEHALALVASPRQATRWLELRQAVGGVWDRMVEAGASPVDLVAVMILVAFIAVAFVLCVAVAANAAREYVRWRLFKRFPVLGEGSEGVDEDDGNDAATATAQRLGVRGVALAALVGALGMALQGALLELVIVSLTSAADAELPDFVPSYKPSLYAATVYLCNGLLDVGVFVGSMLYVATAYATKTVLGDATVDMRKAWTTSVVYNLALRVLRVATPGPGTPVAPPVLVFVCVTVVRAFVVVTFSKRARARFVTACAAQDIASQQGEEA